MLSVAGRQVKDPAARLVTYATAKGGRTIRDYDLPGPGQPCLLSTDEVARTRRINSRISNEQLRCLVDAAGATSLWCTVPVSALLADADPSVHGGLYDDAIRLFNHFLDCRPRGVAHGKVSKVLHVKRPGLIPILDTKVRVLYRASARAAAKVHNQGRAPVRYAFWAAMRNDVINPDNGAALAELRDFLECQSDSVVRSAAKLTDVRLLDILAWGLES
jgi:hypothetical protein